MRILSVLGDFGKIDCDDLHINNSKDQFMASYNTYSGDWYVNVGNGAGTIHFDADVQINGNVTYISELSVNDAFIIAGANNNATSNVTSVGYLAGRPTNPISYAGIRYNATADAWQLSTNVFANGVANTAYVNISTGNYGNSDVVNLLSGFGSNNLFTSGNVVSGNSVANTVITDNILTNFIRSDDSTFVMIQDGLNVDGHIESHGNISANHITVQTVGTTPMPLANLTAVAGARAFINNGNLVALGNFGTQVGGGGSNIVPVWSDGSNWYIG